MDSQFYDSEWHDKIFKVKDLSGDTEKELGRQGSGGDKKIKSMKLIKQSWSNIGKEEKGPGQKYSSGNEKQETNGRESIGLRDRVQREGGWKPSGNRTCCQAIGQLAFIYWKVIPTRVHSLNSRAQIRFWATLSLYLHNSTWKVLKNQEPFIH